MAPAPSPTPTILPLRSRGQLAFAAPTGDWDVRHDEDADLGPGPSLCWRRGAATVRVYALHGPERSADEILGPAEDDHRMAAIRFGDSLRLGRWTLRRPAPDLELVMAMVGGACELMMIASGAADEEAALADLSEIAAFGRFERLAVTE